jgi:hypothetical protein
VICRSVGIETFVPEASGSLEVLRLLFIPSFHPEVVITVTRNSSDIEISVASPKTQLWLEKLPCRLSDYSECLTFKSDEVTDLLRTFATQANCRQPKLVW